MNKKLYIKLLEEKVEALEIENNRLRDRIQVLNVELGTKEFLQTAIVNVDLPSENVCDYGNGVVSTKKWTVDSDDFQ